MTINFLFWKALYKARGFFKSRSNKKPLPQASKVFINALKERLKSNFYTFLKMLGFNFRKGIEGFCDTAIFSGEMFLGGYFFLKG